MPFQVSYFFYQVMEQKPNHSHKEPNQSHDDPSPQIVPGK